jgi:ADP-ribose pyrophosphatase
MAKRSAGGRRVSKSVQRFQGPVFSVYTDWVREAGVKPARRDVVRHGGSVVVLALDDQQRVLLVRQYRHPAGQLLWELPAGGKDQGESFVAGAKRELLEETGCTARSWKRILRFWVSPGFLDEVMEVFLARNITSGKAQPEEDERITLRWFPLHEAVQMARDGHLKDAKTIAGILWLETSRLTT